MLDRATVERALAHPGPLVVALSGGGDSTALLHLLAQTIGPARLRAAVVDHGLRDGSAEDARRALGLATELGVDGEVLTLTGVKRTQAGARGARYAALCAFARAQGAGVIALAHTRDDQAETVFMRAAAGSGWRGLAGMAAFTPAPIWPEGRGLMLARPLLGARRGALRAALVARGARWIEDPANANPAFERVRVRQQLAAHEAAGADVMRLAALAERIAPHVEKLDTAAAALVQRAVRFEADAIQIAPAAWSGAVSVRRRALAALVLAAGAGVREAGGEQLAALEARLSAPSFKSATLAGALLRRASAAILITRDAGALSGRADGASALRPLPLPVGVETIWDGRAAITAPAADWTVIVENGAPALAQNAARLPFTAANPRWLLAERVTRELGLTIRSS